MPRPDALAQLHHAAAGFFPPGESVTCATAHGCLDVLGALEAEGGGTLAQMTLPNQVAVALQPRGDALLRIRSAQIAATSADGDVLLDPAGDLPPQVPWAAGMRELFRLLHPGGANVLIHGDVPLGAGQASSTALLAALARAIVTRDPRAIALARAIHPRDTGATAELATLARLIATAETRALLPPSDHLPQPSRGLVIDAHTCLSPHNRPPTLLRYSAQPHRFVGPVPLPPEVRVFALDTGVRYSAARDTLAELRVAASMGLRIIDTIYRDLGQPHTPLHGYLTNTSPLLYRQYFRTLLPRRLRGHDFLRTYGPIVDASETIPVRPEELDTPRVFRVRTAVDHLIAENEHAEQFLQAMEELADSAAGNVPPIEPAERQRTLQRAGRLLLASHHSYRLRLELSCREADTLVDSLMESGPDRGIYGARITGVGGGGTVVALLDRSGAATDALLQTMRSYHRETGLALGVTEA